MPQMVYGSERQDVGVKVGAPKHLLQWVLPCPCLACGATVWEPDGSLGLCDDCRQDLERWPSPACAVCAVPFPTIADEVPVGYRCGPCRRRSPPYEALISTWCYQPPVDQVLTAFKFRRLDYLGRQLGETMAEIHLSLKEDNDVVVPVPLFWFRRLTRGFNQAHLLAKALASKWDLPCEELLVRRRPTLHQSRLGRGSRLGNLRRAFRVPRPDACRGRRVLLVDDVTTTGATAAAASECLRRAGAAEVRVLTAARPLPEGLSSGELASPGGAR